MYEAFWKGRRIASAETFNGCKGQLLDAAIQFSIPVGDFDKIEFVSKIRSIGWRELQQREKKRRFTNLMWDIIIVGVVSFLLVFLIQIIWGV